jgi:hypothetical protein
MEEELDPSPRPSRVRMRGSLTQPPPLQARRDELDPNCRGCARGGGRPSRYRRRGRAPASSTQARAGELEPRRTLASSNPAVAGARTGEPPRSSRARARSPWRPVAASLSSPRGGSIHEGCRSTSNTKQAHRHGSGGIISVQKHRG